jgi:hypothetical protein
METAKKFKRDLAKSALITGLLALLFVFFNGTGHSWNELLVALPFFIVLYFLFFSVGSGAVSGQLQKWMDSDVRKMVIFPFVLFLLFVGYVLLNDENPFGGVLSLVPYLLIFPVLAFASRKTKLTKLDWYDFAVFVIFLLPTTLIHVNPAGNLPFSGANFDSVYRISVILIAVYSFGIIRKLDDVGFVPEFKSKKLWTALWVWAAFYLFVLAIGIPVHFIKVTGHNAVTFELIRTILFTLLVTFLHTAVFEELFFRGILQNMLSKRIAQSGAWLVFWKWGFVILVPLALLVGYSLKGGMHWFPAFMTILLFAAAFGIEKSGKNAVGVYTALAITSTLFGLVHFHSGAIVYIGFACVAGWAYGFTYLKTKNVFYSALVHTLVNSSALIFGLELVR